MTFLELVPTVRNHVTGRPGMFLALPLTAGVHGGHCNFYYEGPEPSAI